MATCCDLVGMDWTSWLVSRMGLLEYTETKYIAAFPGNDGQAAGSRPLFRVCCI
jgi:hypothetical protein